MRGVLESYHRMHMSLNHQLVIDLLLVAVPLEAQKIYCVEDLINDGLHIKASNVIAANADLLFEGDPNVFRTVVEALAILSKMPGGVRFLGEKFVSQ